MYFATHGHWREWVSRTYVVAAQRYTGRISVQRKQKTKEKEHAQKNSHTPKWKPNFQPHKFLETNVQCEIGKRCIFLDFALQEHSL